MKMTKLKQLHIEWSRWRYPNFPDHLRTYPPFFKKAKTTNGLTQCIIHYFMCKGWLFERVNNQGRYIDNSRVIENVIGSKVIGSKQWIPGTGQKGTADIHGVIDGKSVKIEVKNKKTRDRMSKDQKKYQDMTDISGGIYYIATDLESFLEWAEQFPVNKNRKKLWEQIKH